MKLEFERYTKLRNQISLSKKRPQERPSFSRHTRKEKRHSCTLHSARSGIEAWKAAVYCAATAASRRQPRPAAAAATAQGWTGALKAGLKIRAGLAVVASRIAFDQIYF